MISALTFDLALEHSVLFLELFVLLLHILKFLPYLADDDLNQAMMLSYLIQEQIFLAFDANHFLLSTEIMLVKKFVKVFKISSIHQMMVKFGLVNFLMAAFWVIRRTNTQILIEAEVRLL